MMQMTRQIFPDGSRLIIRVGRHTGVAKLKLVAGDVNRVKDEYEYKDKMLRAAEMAAKSCTSV